MSPSLEIFLFGSCLIILICPLPTEQISNEAFATLNYEQKLKFDEFRERMVRRMPHDYMKEDVYLVRWLRDSYFNVTYAEERILNNLKWREENSMDNILEEDWSDLDEEYKYTVTGCDREGKPVITADAGDWDLRRAIITGRTDRLKRYFNRLFEESMALLRKMDANATQFITVMDMSNFNLVTQGCPRCLPLLMNMLSTYQQHFPGTAHKVAAINVPGYALPLWEIFKHLLDPNTRAVFRFYGRNSKEWKRSLFEDIDPSELPSRYGGTRENPSAEMDSIRRNGLTFKCFSKSKSDDLSFY